MRRLSQCSGALLPGGVAISAPRGRRGFTLVELLVAVAIFLVLASLSFGAFNAATNGDRGSAAGSSFRAWVEGAKSRAAELGRPVGIRPVISADNRNAFGHGTGEFEFVASVAPITGTLAYVDHFVWVNSGTGERIHQWRVGQLVSQPPTSRRREVADPVFWSDLDGGPGELALIRPGIRIEIPANSGNWYTVADDDPRTELYNEFGPDHFAETADSSLGNYLTLVGGPTGEPFLSGTAVPAAVTGVPQYLGGNPAYLSGFDAFTETVGGVDEHTIPTAEDGAGNDWLLTAPQPREYFRLASPVFGNADPSTDPPPYPAFQPRLTYRMELGVDVLEGERVLRLPRNMVMDFDASRMPNYPTAHDAPFPADPLMFSPTGEIVGDYQGLSALAFFFCERDELITSRTVDEHPANPGTQGPPTTKYENWASAVQAGTTVPPVRVEPVGDPQIVTLLPKTGFVQKSVVNFEDTDGDGFANDPYAFRFEGRLDQ